jgi:hypothetical protein
MGVQLLTDGYGRELLLDARTNRTFFGRSQAEWAGDFITKTAANLPGQVKVCPITADTTAEEVYEAGNCLKGHSIRSVLLVVGDFHCRRSLAIFSRLLPHYHWSIAAVQDPMRFGGHWWLKREWIRTVLVEWQHLLWWEMVDRWRFAPQIGQGSVWLPATVITSSLGWSGQPKSELGGLLEADVEMSESASDSLGSTQLSLRR